MERREFLQQTGLMSTAALLGSATLAEEKGLRRMRAIGYRGVTINDAFLKPQWLRNVAFYTEIPNDDWLKPYRLRAGKSAPGNDLGGGYTSNTWHVFGQVVSGLARCYAATGEATLKAKVDALIAGWYECLANNGFFFPFGQKNRLTPHPHYVYEKMVCGLVDAQLYCQSPHALSGLRRITDWAERNLEYTNRYNYNSGFGPTEWYTLSENLLRAYTVTGEERYRVFADRWNYSEFWDLFGTRTDIFTKAAEYHAYSHINSLNGAAEFYRVTGDERYLRDVLGAYDWLEREQMYATGGWGPNEKMLPLSGPGRKLVESATNHFETQCGTWAAMKLTKHLTTFTGHSRWGNWMERLLYNGLAASLPTKADGSIFYFSSYGVDGCAKAHKYRWVCCNGTLIQAWADLHDQVYYRGATDGVTNNEVYLNLFVASALQMELDGQPVTITLNTRFPFEDTLRLTVQGKRPVELALKLRAPDWLAGKMSATLNGAPVKLTSEADGWTGLRHRWNANDTLTVKLPMNFRLQAMPPLENFTPTAVNYGPLTMAVVKRGDEANPGALLDFENLNATLLPLRDASLLFTTRQDAQLRLKPYLSFAENEPYFVYLKRPLPHRKIS